MRISLYLTGAPIPGRIRPSPPRARRRGSSALTVPTEDALHLVFELKLVFLEIDFFDLLGLGEVRLFGELVKSVVEVVVPGGEVAEFLVALQQQIFEILFLRVHIAPPGV
jgi:hypothetical protein